MLPDFGNIGEGLGNTIMQRGSFRPQTVKYKEKFFVYRNAFLMIGSGRHKD